MPWTALLLVLAAAVLHASGSSVAKCAGGDRRFTLPTGLLTSVLWLFAGRWFWLARVAALGLDGGGRLGVCGGVFLIAGGPALWRRSSVYASARAGASTSAAADVRWAQDCEHVHAALCVGLQARTLSRHRAGLANGWRLQGRAALLGGYLLGECDRGLRLPGAACRALGVTALALS